MAAGYKDFVAGAVLTAADLEDYCEAQSIMRFASAAARDTALSVIKTEGMMAYLVDVNTLTVYSGSAWSTVGPVHGVWTSFTPTWSGTLGNGTKTGFYMRVGRSVTFRIKMTWGSTTTHAATTQTWSLPVSSHTEYGLGAHVGTASMYDNSAAAYASGGTCAITTGDTIGVQNFASATFWSNTSPVTWATSDVGVLIGTYEAAADA